MLKPTVLEPEYYLNGFIIRVEVVKVLKLLGFQHEGEGDSFRGKRLFVLCKYWAHREKEARK